MDTGMDEIWADKRNPTEVHLTKQHPSPCRWAGGDGDGIGEHGAQYLKE